MYSSKYKNWKYGDKIVCVNNLDCSNILTVGRVYTVEAYYKEYGVETVHINNDGVLISSSIFYAYRFSTLIEYEKISRKQKLEKLNTL